MLRLTKKMTTRGCVWKSGSLMAKLRLFHMQLLRRAKCFLGRTDCGLSQRALAPDPVGVHLCRISSQTQTGGTMKLNTARVWLGGIAGGVVWIAWGFFVG